MTHRRAHLLPILVLFLFAASGCGGASSKKAELSTDNASDAAGPTATATLRSTSGSSVQGTVTFTQEGDGVRVFALLSGLTPGDHGFHIHETGDCSAPDGSSAGGHFNPGGMPHGGPDAAQHHAGDLGNITADQAGNATYEGVDTQVSLLEGPNSIIGRAIVVHEAADDMTSQPSGSAGARIACGVIEASSH